MSESHLNRRAVVGIGLGLAATAIGSHASAGRPPQPTTCPPPDTGEGGFKDPGQSVRLETPLGALIGSEVTVDGEKILSFKGIPYALPPVGDRRWKPAAPAPGWNCTRDARAFSPQAVQLTEPDTAFFSLPQSVQNEDCLYLNIWTPEAPTAPKSGRPVMVWIHGGAFIGGAGSLPVYDGAALARKGVLVVSINYRLGVFGYYTHPDLIEEADGGICANFGTTDQIAALKWVQENIAAFGGDPDQVTIFGESAGSMSVCQLMASPLTTGLFHRAIGQSGGYFYPMREIGRAAWGGPPAEEIGKIFAQRIGAPSLADLRKMPAQDLAVAAAAEGELLNQLGAMIVVDGQVFDRQIHETFKSGRQQPVPVLLGFNADEGSGIADYGGIPSISDPVKYEAEVRHRYGLLADEYLALYPASDPQDSALAAFRDDAFGWHMMEWADLMSRVSRDVFFYHFVHAPPGAEQTRAVFNGPNFHRIGAHHASEIAYAFNNMNYPILSVWGDGEPNPNRPFGPVRPVDIRLADIMSDYWVTFAKSGVPRVEGRPEWRTYERATGHYMRFGPEATPSQNLLPGMWETQSKIMNARRASDAFWYFANEGLAGPVITAG
jgi:para-nitrobenzyl esterase